MLVIAHRGASADAAENTPAAFALAETQRADGVELDVRHASDGTLVVAHDPLPPALDRDATGHVDLRTALGAMSSHVLVNVEIKNLASDGGFDPTMAVVDDVVGELRSAGDASRWLVSSFSPATIDACRSVAPDIAVALLAVGMDDEGLARAAANGYSAVHPHESTVDAGLVERCHAAGLAVNTWTVNEPERIVELARLGVDGVVTDVPAVAVAALEHTPSIDGAATTGVGVSHWARWEKPA
ncbi:MAG: glycerophosphodiester phosphodiesterase [Actinomycetota bacterium]